VSAMESAYDDYDDDDFSCYDEGIEDERDEWVLACGYPGCCMPGYHFRSECHNAEDMEAMYAEHEPPQPKCSCPFGDGAMFHLQGCALRTIPEHG
jgi:hypothetical protein